MPSLRSTRRPAVRLPRGARVFGCAVHGHRWDVAPGHRRGPQMECVRCGMRAEPAAGLSR